MGLIQMEKPTATFGMQEPFPMGQSNQRPPLSPEPSQLLPKGCRGRAHSPLRSRLWVESCRALSGQFQRSHPNWNLHSSIPLCAPAATLLEYVR